MLCSYVKYAKNSATDSLNLSAIHVSPYSIGLASARAGTRGCPSGNATSRKVRRFKEIMQHCMYGASEGRVANADNLTSYFGSDNEN